MKDFLPAVYPNDGGFNNADMQTRRWNTVPYLLANGEISLAPRNYFASYLNAAAADADRGRGVTTFAGVTDIYLDQTSYYYDGGSQDLKASTGAGFAGNNGFNSDYLGVFSRSLISGVSNLLIQGGGETSTNIGAEHGNLWYVANGQSVPTSVSDADMPGNNGVSTTRGVAALDGYVFLCDITGKIYNSALNDITSWTATNFITAEREPDYGVYLGKHHNHVVYIGTRSVEFFYNAGNATGSPLARRQDVSYRVGCYYPNSVLEDGDIIYFFGTELGSGITRLYKIENFQLVRISNQHIEERIGNLSETNDINIAGLTGLNANVYVCQMPMENTGGLLVNIAGVAPGCFYLNMDTGLWCHWGIEGATPTYKGGLSSWSTLLPIVSYYRGSPRDSVSRYQFINGVVANTNATGYDNAAGADIGITRTLSPPYCEFPIWDAGTDMKKRINWMRVISAPNAGSTGTFNPVTVGVKYIDLDRTTGGVDPSSETQRNVDINLTNAKLGRLGTTRKRKFMIEWDAAFGPVSQIKGLEIDYEVVGE